MDCPLQVSIRPPSLCYPSTFSCFQWARCVVFLFLQLENQNTKTSESKSTKSLRCLNFLYVAGALSTLPVVMKEICYTWSKSKCSTLSHEHPSSLAMRVPIPCPPQRVFHRVSAAPSVKYNTNTNKIKSRHFLSRVLLFLLPPIALKFKDTL